MDAELVWVRVAVHVWLLVKAVFATDGSASVLATLPELSLQIVEFAREHGRVTMADAVKLTEANRNTLKQHFRNLVARGHLQQQGGGRGVWYGLG